MDDDTFSYESLVRSFLRRRPLMQPHCPYNSYVNEVIFVWRSGRDWGIVCLLVLLTVIAYASFYAVGKQVAISIALFPLLAAALHSQIKIWHDAEKRARSVLRWCFDRSEERDNARREKLDRWVAREVQQNRT